MSRKSEHLFLAVALVMLAPTLAASCFDPPVRFMVTGPGGVAVGDLNDDGKLDFVTTNGKPGNSVGVYLGNGDGTFQERQNYAAKDPMAPVLADFNHDGILDLGVALASGGDNISVFPGKGDGTFRTPKFYRAGHSPVSLLVGDFNSDGQQDLLVGDNFLMSHLLLGNGFFNFTLRRIDGFTGMQFAASDFNRDGKLDIAFNKEVSRVSIELGIGDGTFGTEGYYPTGEGPVDIIAVDLNGDGNLDLVTANYTEWNVSVLLGLGDGTFGPTQNYPAGPSPRRVVAADFNRDGALDLLVGTDEYGSAASLLLGNGDGAFQRGQLIPGLEGGPVAAGDFNGDGWPDFVVASIRRNLSVFLNSAECP